MNREELLRIEDINVTFSLYKKRLTKEEVTGIRNISFTIEKGEVVALVGASGSGKSLLAHAIMGLLPYNATVTGNIYYRGQLMTDAYQDKLRGDTVAFIPQSITYLDPTMKIDKQIMGNKYTWRECVEVFRRLGLQDEVGSLYPFQLSGGMARRVLVSTALVSGAELIIADEPTPGMEVKDAIEALRMLRELANEGKSSLLITHDLELAIGVSDRVVVFYNGCLIDIANVEDFRCIENLKHPYTRAMVRALPQNEFKVYDNACVDNILGRREDGLC